MTDFQNLKESNGFAAKLWRGERMCLLGFDLTDPEPDFVGFAVECRSPGSNEFFPLRNRLTFADANGAVTGDRQFPSTAAPFQKFRWIHFPKEPRAGTYTYRVTKMHMPRDNQLRKGTGHTLDISLDPVTYDDFLDIGFTRNFASSQAYAERFRNRDDILPALADDGLDFDKAAVGNEVYSWLGFEAHALLFGFLQEAIDNPRISLDVLAYDLNEPDIVACLERMGQRLRIVIDNSKSVKNGQTTGHVLPGSAESQAAKRLRKSAGRNNVTRTCFQNLQHHKVFIAKLDGRPFKVLAGSTNFSFRGLYIQANNVLLFHDGDVASLYEMMFDLAFHDPENFKKAPLARKWHLIEKPGKPIIHVCFSPHTSSDLSLNPVRGAIDQATSSVFYSIAFLNQIKSGPTKEALDRLMTRPLFSYGVVDTAGSLEVRKPDGSIGLVDFAYLSDKAPEPFKSEWSAGRGINIHHKFVVTDFNLENAKVFTGSSNLAPSGESKNGDHLVMIEDRKIATSYAIEAIRMFDHLHFRTRMKAAEKKKQGARALHLRKPTAISGQPAWFEPYYQADSQRERDRLIFSR